MLLDLADAPDEDVTEAYQAGAQALDDAGVQRADLLPEYADRYPAWPASPQLFALTLALAGDLDRAREILPTALPAFPDATYELDIALVGLTAIHPDDKHIAEMAYQALLPSADEILGPGACVFVPVRQVLAELHRRGIDGSRFAKPAAVWAASEDSKRGRTRGLPHGTPATGASRRAGLPSGWRRDRGCLVHNDARPRPYARSFVSRSVASWDVRSAPRW